MSKNLPEIPTAQDIFLFGTPGSKLDEQGNLHISQAAITCTELAADYWLSNQPITERIISLGGFPGMRDGMSRPPRGQSEAIISNTLLRAAGVPTEAIVPPEDQEGLRYAHSTVDEICLSLEYGLTHPDKYSPNSPLGVVISTPGHARRAADAFSKVGFDKRALLFMHGSETTPAVERVARVLYGLFVVSGATTISTDSLRKREDRLMRTLGR